MCGHGTGSNRAENCILPLPKLAADKMRTRHEEISTWTAYREELTSWLCLLDDRYSEELQEAIESSVPVAQLSFSKGKAARSTKLWYLLKQALTGFQRGTDIAKFVELRQGGAAAGYELWHELDKELSVRSRVEGQALREQALLIAPPKHLRRPLDIFRHMISDFVRYRKLVVAKFPDLDLQHADIISCILKHLHDDCKKYLLLHGSLTTLEQLERGLVFYDEQLRVLNFHKEASHAKGFAAFGADQPDKGQPKGKGKDHGKDGEEKGKGKGRTKGRARTKEPKVVARKAVARIAGRGVLPQLARRSQEPVTVTTATSLATGPMSAESASLMRRPLLQRRLRQPKACSRRRHRRLLHLLCLRRLLGKVLVRSARPLC